MTFISLSYMHRKVVRWTYHMKYYTVKIIGMDKLLLRVPYKMLNIYNSIL